MFKRASDLRPGDLIDVPEHLTVGTDNEVVGRYEFGEVESVGGGWADALARPTEVVVYVPTFVAPIVCPEWQEFEVVGQLPEVLR